MSRRPMDTESSTPTRTRCLPPAFSFRRTRRCASRETWRACRFRWAISRAATTPPSRLWSNIMPHDADQAVVLRRPALQTDGVVDRRQGPGGSLFSGPYYFLEQLGFRKVMDTTFMMASMITGDPESGRRCASTSARCGARSGISTFGPNCTLTTTRRRCRSNSTRRWTRAAGDRASVWYSNPTHARCSKNPSSGSLDMPSFPKDKWARASIKTR